MIGRVWWLVVGMLVGVSLAYGVTFIVLWSQLEKRFVFFPASELLFTPSNVGLYYEDVRLRTSDGFTLHAWFIPGDLTMAPKATWVWFHGNGGNNGYRIDELALAHHRTNANLFIFDYRGYGESDGSPSEKGTYLDSRAAMDYLLSRSDVDQDHIIYLGHSLGAAVAVELASTHPPMAMVLVSPFSSIGDMARIAFPFPTVGWLVRNHFDSLTRIRHLSVPVLVLHGDQDKIVPLSQGRKLYEAANEPKRFQVLEGAAHNDTYEVGGEKYWSTIETFIADHWIEGK